MIISSNDVIDGCLCLTTKDFFYSEKVTDDDTSGIVKLESVQAGACRWY